MRARWAGFGVCLCVVAALVAGSYFTGGKLEERGRVRSVGRVAMVASGAEPAEATLAVAGAALGFDHAAADILFIQVIQSFGNLYLTRTTNYERMHSLIRTIGFLSPHFVPVYSFGALVFEELGHVDDALALLDEGIVNNPFAFELRLYRDFSIYLFKTHEYGKAIDGILRSMQLEGYPPQLERILAYAYEEDGQTEKALQQWRRVWELAGNEHLRQISMRHIKRLENQR